jgi:type IV pilus assembly protein PilB
MPSRKIITKPLGELLIDLGIITRENLDKALSAQKHKEGGLIGEILVEMGFAKEEDIAQVITVQYGFPYLPLSNYDISPEVIKIIPFNTAKACMVIPIDKIGNNLTVAMANPLNDKAIDELEAQTGCNVQVFIATLSDVKNAIAKYYKQPV